MGVGITVMVAAYNEESYLKETVLNLDRVLKPIFEEYEIVIFDDGSTDGTHDISEDLAKNNKKIRVIHNNGNKGLGYNYRTGLMLAKKEHYCWVPGDGEIDEDSLKNVFINVGEKDMILSFTENQKVRSFSRRFLSQGYTKLLNTLFGLNLKYYNGIAIFKTEDLKKVRMSTNSYAFQSEIIISLIKHRSSFKEVPMKIKPRKVTRIFKVKNIIGIIHTVLSLYIRNIFGRLYLD